MLEAADGAQAAGWPAFHKSKVHASPLLYDIDSDGVQDILIATYDGQILAFRDTVRRHLSARERLAAELRPRQGAVTIIACCPAAPQHALQSPQRWRSTVMNCVILNISTLTWIPFVGVKRDLNCLPGSVALLVVPDHAEPLRISAQGESMMGAAYRGAAEGAPRLV